jgi:hypothetical protein
MTDQAKKSLYGTITIELFADAQDIVDRESVLFTVAERLTNQMEAFLDDHESQRYFLVDVDLK